MKEIKEWPCHTCPQCHTLHKFAVDPSNLSQIQSCEQCGSRLSQLIEVDISDNCLLCKCEYKKDEVTVRIAAEDGVEYWLCNPCNDTPRGLFLQEMIAPEQDDYVCEICENAAELITFTHDDEGDGIFICVTCSTQTAKGIEYTRQHQAIINDLKNNV